MRRERAAASVGREMGDEGGRGGRVKGDEWTTGLAKYMFGIGTGLAAVEAAQCVVNGIAGGVRGIVLNEI